MTHTLQVIALLAAVVIFWRVEPAINLMGGNCRLPIRFAFWLLAVGSAGLVLSITQGYVPSWPVTLICVGLAIMLTYERRLHGVFQRPRAS